MSEENCYICGRSEGDLGFIREILAQFDREAERLTVSLRVTEEKAQQESRALTDLFAAVDAKYLEFTPRTIKTDMATFTKHVPVIGELLAECAKQPGYGDNKTLRELLATTDPSKKPIVVRKQKDLDDLLARKVAYQNSPHMRTFEFRLSALCSGQQLAPQRDGDAPTIRAKLCPVCEAILATVTREHIPEYRP